MIDTDPFSHSMHDAFVEQADLDSTDADKSYE